jgi:hypothetical protein
VNPKMYIFLDAISTIKKYMPSARSSLPWWRQLHHIFMVHFWQITAHHIHYNWDISALYFSRINFANPTSFIKCQLLSVCHYLTLFIIQILFVDIAFSIFIRNMCFLKLFSRFMLAVLWIIYPLTVRCSKENWF